MNSRNDKDRQRHDEKEMNRYDAAPNYGRGEQRYRNQEHESDSLFPKQNYYNGNDQERHGQTGRQRQDSHYPNANYSRGDNSPRNNDRQDSSFGGGFYIGQGSGYRGSSIGGSSYQMGNQHQGSSVSGSYPQGTGSDSSPISGSFGEDNGYQGTSTWRGQSTDDKDSSYSWGQRQQPTGRGDSSLHTGPSFHGKGPKGYKRSDERIREEVSDALYHDHAVDASEIEIAVQNGEITLTGTVPSRQMKRLAEDCVEYVSGVTDVRNELRVQSASNMNGGSTESEMAKMNSDKTKKPVPNKLM